MAYLYFSALIFYPTAMLNRMLTQKEQFAILFLGAAAVFGGLTLWLSKDRSHEALVPPVPVVGEVSDASTVPAGRNSLPTSPTDVSETPTAYVAPPPSPDIAVAVMGAVESGGLFRVPPDMRVGEIIEKAGGVTQDADLRDINLGARLIDGTTLTIPARMAFEPNDKTLTNRTALPYTPNPRQYTRTYAAWYPEDAEKPAGVSESAPKSASNALINLNTASQTELETLPGIGPAFAQRIIEFRERSPFTSVEELDDVPGIGPKRLAELRTLVTVE